jgi:uncharacterized protein
MKINLSQIPQQGLIFEEKIIPAALDLETEVVRLRDPIEVRGEVSRITNAVVVKLVLDTKLYLVCSRCLNEFKVDLQKDLQLSYSVSKQDLMIDVDPDIRQEIILDYPIKPLCKPNCQGLCRKCGKNLNEGGCSCAFT